MTRTLLTAIFLTLFSHTALGSTKLICGYDENWGVGYEGWSLTDVQSDDIIKSLQREHMIIEVNKEKEEITFGHSIGPKGIMDEPIRAMPVKILAEHSTSYYYWATDISETKEEGLRFEIKIDRIDGSFEIGMTTTSKDKETGKFKSDSSLLYAGICQPYYEKLIKF